MRGWIYRRAVGLKEFGERHRLDLIIKVGLALREWIIKYPIR